MTAPELPGLPNGSAQTECDPFQILLSAYLDAEINDSDREKLDIHLAECPSCRLELADWTQQDRQLRSLFAARQPHIAAVAERVRARLSAQTVARCSVLVVDDEPYILPALRSLLAPEYEVMTANSADQAQTLIQSRPVDILLTDQRMPRRTGTSLLEWAREHSPNTVRLLMTGFSELEDAIEAINRGHVYYYLLKPWRTQDVLQVMRNAADKFSLERKRERYLADLRQLNRELEDRVAERTRELAGANLLLEQRARELERLALTDSLTGLFNRRAVDELARFELKRHARYPSPLTIGYVDVDHFKDVNTLYHLPGGDEVLRVLARILLSSVREVDTVGRVGGEEFLVIARETGLEGAATLAERIRSTVAGTVINYKGARIRITVSVGFAVADIGVPTDYGEMLELSAAALAQAKESGRNRCEIRMVQRAQAG
jgi:diguanylate cyclase (GGDEF)-like protein